MPSDSQNILIFCVNSLQPDQADKMSGLIWL